jgi:hypothetical protein
MALVVTKELAAQGPTISIGWPSPNVVLLQGPQVGFWGNISGYTTRLTPEVSLQNAAGQWAQGNGTWGSSQQWLPATLLDAAGDWRFLYAPNVGGVVTLIAQLQDASGNVLSTAQTTFQVQGAAPAAAAVADTISLQWPTPSVVMTPGVQVGIWGVATGSPAAAVSVSIQNNQTGLWLNTGGSWGAQTWFNAPFLDSSGTWRWSYAPAGGGSYTVMAQLVDGATTMQASSTFSVLTPAPVPPPPAPTQSGSFPVQIVNGTGGRWNNTDIWLTILGQYTAGQWASVTPDGVIHPLDSTQANASGHLTYKGQNYAPLSFQLPASGAITMPSGILGGRLYISLGSPLYLGIPANNSGIALPDANNPSDPNANTYWDFYEFAFISGQLNYGGDTSQVDQFGFPINVRVQQASSGVDFSSGFTVPRAQIFAQFLNNSDPQYRALANAYHILAPRTSTQFLASADSAAMQAYINAVWQQYTQAPFTLTANNQTYSGGVEADGALHFSAAGTSGYVLQKPSAQDVWQCSGNLASGLPAELALGAQFCAAFNRGVAGNTGNWLNSATYYQGAVQNQYAAYIHSVALHQLSYSFAYDDVNNQSSLVILPNSAPPSVVTLTVGW